MVTELPRPKQPLPLIQARAGELVVRQGEPELPPHVVASGALLTLAVLPDGQVLAPDVLGPGDLVGDPSGGPAAVSVRALSFSRLRPAAEAEVISLLSRRACRLAELACDLAWLGVAERVERRLVDLAARFGQPGRDGLYVRLALTQEDLAALCGTSRESTNRAIRRLQEGQRVSVEGRGRYVVAVPSCNRMRLQVLQ
jgi:cAMP-binding proteins - catabolite gene activator and regulatory subunit of cAMP-dependent protein kinases